MGLVVILQTQQKIDLATIPNIHQIFLINYLNDHIFNNKSD
jgi:hypothetical protein